MSAPSRFTKLLAATALIAALAGCSSEPASEPKAESIATATPTVEAAPPEDDRWEDPTVSKLDDQVRAESARVDPDGTPHGGSSAENIASKPETPAPIAENGDIFVTFIWRGSLVSRYVTDAYISPDAKGKERGPKMECEPTANALPQFFVCSARFQDADYGTGIYYGVIITEPAQQGFEEYDTLKSINPAYTKLPE